MNNKDKSTMFTDGKKIQYLNFCKNNYLNLVFSFHRISGFILQATRWSFCQCPRPFSNTKLKQGSPSEIAWNRNSGLAFAVAVAFGLSEIDVIRETKEGGDSYGTRWHFVKDVEEYNWRNVNVMKGISETWKSIEWNY